MLTHRKFYSWNRALRFVPLSRDTAVRARVPRTPGWLGFVWNSDWETHQNISNTPPQTAPSSWRCRLSLSRTVSIFNDNVQVWTTKSHRNNEASKLVWVFLSWAGTCLQDLTSFWCTHQTATREGFICVLEKQDGLTAHCIRTRKGWPYFDLPAAWNWVGSLKFLWFQTFLHIPGKHGAVWCQTAAAFYCFS